MRKTLLLLFAVALCLAVPALAAQAQSADESAAKKCKAERAQLGVDAFATRYGTNKNKANAFGKCVSKLSKASKADKDETGADEAGENSSKKCKAERARIGADAFKAKYGTNKNKANAHGKCVSKLSKEKRSS